MATKSTSTFYTRQKYDKTGHLITENYVRVTVRDTATGKIVSSATVRMSAQQASILFRGRESGQLKEEQIRRSVMNFKENPLDGRYVTARKDFTASIIKSFNLNKDLAREFKALMDSIGDHQFHEYLEKYGDEANDTWALYHSIWREGTRRLNNAEGEARVRLIMAHIREFL